MQNYRYLQCQAAPANVVLAMVKKTWQHGDGPESLQANSQTHMHQEGGVRSRVSSSATTEVFPWKAGWDMGCKPIERLGGVTCVTQ